MHVDAVDLEVVKASLSGIVQEMQNSLFRTGFSTIVRESQDASCALMNDKGEVVAQHVVLPLHIGAFPACCGAVIREFGATIAEGDAFLINHPYEGGSPHAPDMCVLSPVFVEGALFGFCGSIAHKSDIGGPVPGSCSGQARETFNEGLHLPAVRYHRKGKAIGDIERIIGANSRTPELVLGDIRGQLGSDRLGERRLIELVAKFGKEKILACFDRLFELSESKLRKTFAEWKDGRFEAERFVDDDGVDLEKPVRIHVVVEKKGDSIHFDFSGSADQTKGPANVRPPLVQAACAYCLISLIDPATCSTRASPPRSIPTIRPCTRWSTRSTTRSPISCPTRCAPTAAAAAPSSSADAAPTPERATCNTRSSPAAPARAPPRTARRASRSIRAMP
jgi:N-methylhydantoinase B